MGKMVQAVRKIWNEWKKVPVDLWFFGLFLLVSTLGIRKVLLFFPINGVFNEYEGVYVYLSDVFLVFTVLTWAYIILNNKKYYLSIKTKAHEFIHKLFCVKNVDKCISANAPLREKALDEVFIRKNEKLFHVEHSSSETVVNCSTWNNFNIFTISKSPRLIFLIPLVLFFWSLLSLFWSKMAIIGIFRSLKLLEGYLLFLYVSIRLAPNLLLSDHWRFGSSKEIVPRGTSGYAVNDGNVPRGTILLSRMTRWFFVAIIGAFSFVMLFDHYFWDIWQGQILFWMAAGIVAGAGFNIGSIYNKNVPRGTIEIVGDADNVPPRKILNCSTWNNLEIRGRRGTFCYLELFGYIVASIGVIQSIIAVIQVILQHSIGLFWLKESIISPNIDGVAKIVIANERFIRGYGLFPHPNVLGGFLIFSIVVTLLLKKVLDFGETQKSDAQLIIINVFLLIQVFGILASFSKSAIIGLFLALMYIIVPRGTISDMRDDKNVPRGTKLISKLAKIFHPEKFQIVPRGTIWKYGAGVEQYLIFIPVLVVFLVLILFGLDFKAFLMNSWYGRDIYLEASFALIIKNPIVGVGIGQFIPAMFNNLPTLSYWQYQPVHNVFLLVWSELGIIGLVLFILFLWNLIFFGSYVPNIMDDMKK